MAKNNIQSHRRRAFHRQQGRCYYCDELMLEPTFCCSNLRCTAEHLIPRSEGGLNTAENIVAACWRCNSRRHRRRVIPSPEEHRYRVQKLHKEGGTSRNPYIAI